MGKGRPARRSARADPSSEPAAPFDPTAPLTDDELAQARLHCEALGLEVPAATNRGLQRRDRPVLRALEPKLIASVKGARCVPIGELRAIWRSWAELAGGRGGWGWGFVRNATGGGRWVHTIGAPNPVDLAGPDLAARERAMRLAVDAVEALLRGADRRRGEIPVEAFETRPDGRIVAVPEHVQSYRRDQALGKLYTDAAAAMRELCAVAGVAPRLALEAEMHSASDAILVAQKAGDDVARKVAFRRYVAACRDDRWAHEIEHVGAEVVSWQGHLWRTIKCARCGADKGSDRSREACPRSRYPDAVAIVARFLHLSPRSVERDAGLGAV